jgi:glycosyltransferase involved in cell wall biosynthesis
LEDFKLSGDRIENFPLVTVVTPSYNQGRFINQTIESVLSQNYPHLEYLVIDGGSTDDTVSILDSYGDRLSWISQPDSGQGHAINKGWRQGKGDVLAWLNSDDVYLPGAIRNGVDYLLRNPNISMVYGEAYHVAEDGGLINRYPTEPFDVGRLIDTCIICQPATFMRRTVIEDVGYLDESLKFCLDYELWIRISKKYSIGYLSEYLAKSRLHAECKTMKDRLAIYQEALGVLKRHYRFVPPSWMEGYARVMLQRYFDRSVAWQNSCFIFCVMMLCGWKFMQYNNRIPFTELERWVRSLRQGMRKLFAD